jgi:ATP-dependent Clp protease adaptor protein ClpS
MAEGSSEPARRYQLILLDDDDHSYAYVIEMLGRIFGYGKEKAFAIASIVDSQGRAVLETAAFEQVRRHQGQVHAFGPDARMERCRWSMSALIDEAP